MTPQPDTTYNNVHVYYTLVDVIYSSETLTCQAMFLATLKQACYQVDGGKQHAGQHVVSKQNQFLFTGNMLPVVGNVAASHPLGSFVVGNMLPAMYVLQSYLLDKEEVGTHDE